MLHLFGTAAPKHRLRKISWSKLRFHNVTAPAGYCFTKAAVLEAIRHASGDTSTAQWSIVNVTLDDDTSEWAVAAYWNGELKNGFVEPCFTLDAMKEIARRYPELLTYNSQKGFLTLDEEAARAVEPRLVDAGEYGSVSLFQFDGWCWFLAE
ncbi:hypothetical protein [Cupriavidus campinensis]|uniref:Uncharacterized protein n=1 Tax=Cupriavidus campinensis TaxID=151783 RepID=A0ABY3EJ91_9BURK|nr:hypothetical protein [Cupriavidus campinensis]TSP11017.1 hypothetical protein FGG12_19335 [Cupriavidus campinensis]